jgi:glycosyltransferase involved in cell wall biosynthesis
LKEVIIIGPAHPLRGGLATFNQRLAKQFMEEGYVTSIYSFSLQYPGFLFPGTTQFSSDPPPENLAIFSRINTINPVNWIRVGHELRKKKPDLIVVRFWLPFMGPALGTILRKVRKNNYTRIVAITDNIIPHEKRPGDTMLTKYFLKSCHGFVSMSSKVMDDLRKFLPIAKARQVTHPLYDNFGESLPKKTARQKLSLKEDDKIILFFGFIRRYKGLDLLMQAMADKRIRELGIRLLIAGEFYEDSNQYTGLASSLGIVEQIIWETHFIPDSEVRNYLCAADVVIQPYRHATQSGVTPLAYHFEKPMIVTNVGSLPALVPHERVGLVCEPSPSSIASTIVHFYELGESHFIPNIQQEKQNYSWSKLTDAIRSVM